MIKIGRYTIIKEDEFNFGLYETREKGSFRGKKAEGTKENLIGYYGYLDVAMSKIISSELLNKLDEHCVAEDIKELITTVKTQLKEAYHHRSSEYKHIGDK